MDVYKSSFSAYDLESAIMQYAGESVVGGMTVIKGEYIPGTTIGTSSLRINHNLGEVKPFFFHMKIADPLEAPGGDCVVSVSIAMFSHDTETITYAAGENTADIPPIATMQIVQANATRRGTHTSNVNVCESFDSAGAVSNFNLKVWPDGFVTGLYQWLQSGAVYEYTLIYGVNL